MINKKEVRFEFGANWRRFLDTLNEDRIRNAEASLKLMLVTENLNGITFLDIGSGSGLFSLAARNLGAKVHSFDYDSNSVECTRVLRSRFHAEDPNWIVDQGSALDESFVNGLGEFDVVYSWGVLHHTGDMRRGLDLAARCVKPSGALFISIYNDQGPSSLLWKKIKYLHSNGPKWRQKIIEGFAFIRLWGPQLMQDFLRGKGLMRWRSYGEGSNRGMSAWHDLVDWVGGYPFEVATPEVMFNFFSDRGFTLSKLKTCGGGIGCNEFIFIKSKPPIPIHLNLESQ